MRLRFLCSLRPFALESPHAQNRHCRSPQRGQIHALQRCHRTHKAATENYPFCTIEPNLGSSRCPIRASRRCSRSPNPAVIPAAIEYLDIAGWSKAPRKRGARQQVSQPHPRSGCPRAGGALLRRRGYRACHRHRRSSPRHRDCDDRAGHRRPRQPAQAPREDRPRREARRQVGARRGGPVEKARAAPASGKPANTLKLFPEERAQARHLFLLTDKPTVFAANVKEDELATADTNPHVAKVRDYAQTHHGCETVVICAQLESDLAI